MPEAGGVVPVGGVVIWPAIGVAAGVVPEPDDAGGVVIVFGAVVVPALVGAVAVEPGAVVAEPVLVAGVAGALAPAAEVMDGAVGAESAGVPEDSEPHPSNASAIKVQALCARRVLKP